MVSTEMRLIIFFAANDEEALYSQQEKKKKRLGADCGSDHELLIAKYRLKLKKVGKTIALTRRTLVRKVMSLVFNMLSRLVIAFRPRNKCLLISWLQLPSACMT